MGGHDGVFEGAADGGADGVAVGSVDGLSVGLRDGAVEGLNVGASDGLTDGLCDGEVVGSADGILVGSSVAPLHVIWIFHKCTKWLEYKISSFRYSCHGVQASTNPVKKPLCSRRLEVAVSYSDTLRV